MNAEARRGHGIDMEIVDTFTRLIFAEAESFDERELAIVNALRRCEPELHMGDSAEMGDFLRALGVTEMIALVSRVHAQMDLPPGQVSPGASAAATLQQR